MIKTFIIVFLLTNVCFAFNATETRPYTIPKRLNESLRTESNNTVILSPKIKNSSDSNNTTTSAVTTSPDNQASVKNAANKTNVPSYSVVLTTFKAGKLNQAKKLALDYLKLYPNDPDVQYILGQIYIKQKQYSQAHQILSNALKNYPKYTDIRITLITLSLKQQNLAHAKTLTQQGLKLQPRNKNLIYYQKKIQSIIEYQPAPNNALVSPQVSARILGNTNFIPSVYGYKNQLGVDGLNTYVSDLQSNWGYEDIYYYHKTPLGVIGARLNAARRLGFAGNQYELEAYPTINKYLYLYLDYANSSVPNIFPNQKYGGNAFFILPYNFVLGAGGKYLKIANTFLRVYETSLDKYIGNTYLLTLKQSNFLPKVGEHSAFYTLVIRRFFNDDPNYYLSVTGGTGKSPDLFDLITVDFFVLRTNLAYSTFQLPLNKHLYISFNLGYQEQVFPSSKHRDLTTYGAGLKFVF